MRVTLFLAIALAFFAADVRGQAVPADKPFPVHLTVGQVFNVCESGEIICPVRTPICDDAKIIELVDMNEGLGFRGAAPGSTLCSVSSGRSLRRVFRITVREE